MTPDELRALADALEPMARAPRFEDFDVPGFCEWVRACADAEPVGYVTANGLRSLRQDDATVLLYAHDYLIRPDHVALYTHPAPAAPQAEQPIDLDAVAMQQMRQAAAESTWMPAEYSGDDWISDVCRWLRDGPPQAEPIDPHMIVADDRFPDEQAEPKRDQPLLDLLAVIHCDGGHHTEAVGIEQSIKDAQVAVSELKNSLATGDNDATRTVEREPLSDWRIGELYRQWLAESETTTIADLMRSVERAHEIGGSDAE